MLVHGAQVGGQPPVAAFWSITMYNLDYNLVLNPINRYLICDRSGTTTAPDGSLTLYVQHDPAQRRQAAQLAAHTDR